MNKKKSIGIVTITSHNLGNRLQNYALQEYLLSKNYDVKTIPKNSYTAIKMELKRLKFIIKLLLSKFIKKYKSVSWECFNGKINWENYSVKDNAEALVKKYDYFVAGSDQIWNPIFNLDRNKMFLTFARKEQKIAYAASIGISELPKEWEEFYAKNIKEFTSISVREDDAAKIIKNLTGRSVKVLIDPTMLLTKEKWEEVTKDSRININYKYVVKYFLGPRNDKYDEYIENRAKEIGAKVLDVTEYNEENNDVIGPAEFVYLIANSNGVFTDSFHGTVFSLLFEKPFIVFDRAVEKETGNMSSRLDTLLNKFNIKGQRIVDVSELDNIHPEVDYKKIGEILQKERKLAEEYLEEALNK